MTSRTYMEMCWLMLVFLCPLLHVGWSGGTIEVKFIKYEASCTEDVNNNKCDPQFTFCMDRPDTSPISISRANCFYDATRESGHFQDRNNINFDADMRGIKNPWLVKFTKLMDKGVRLVFRVRDDDFFGGDDHLHTWSKDLTEKVYESVNEAKWASRSTSEKGYTLKFQIRIYCDFNYYTADCSKECKAPDDRSDHFYCEAGTGERKCMKGWTGPKCNEDIDECQLGYCGRGTCENLDGDYFCHCPVLYTGKNCTQMEEHCDPHPCLNNGTCEPSLDHPGYSCKCPAMWKGLHCETWVDPCDSQPCFNGGSCYSGGMNSTEFNCTCLPMFTGSTCETSTDFSPTSSIRPTVTTDGDQARRRAEDDDGLAPWMAALICVLVLLILAALVLCFVLYRRRRKQKAKAYHDGLPPGATVVTFDGDNLAFENTMYNDVNRLNGCAIHERQMRTVPPTTPSEDELFNPVKPTFRPEDLQQNGAQGGYPEMDVDGYVQPMKSFCASGFEKDFKDDNLSRSAGPQRAQENPYADFHNIKKEADSSVPADEHHYQDLDEAAMAVRRLDAMVSEKDDSHSYLAGSLDFDIAPNSQSEEKNWKSPSKIHSKNESYTNVPLNAPKYPIFGSGDEESYSDLPRNTPQNKEEYTLPSPPPPPPPRGTEKKNGWDDDLNTGYMEADPHRFSGTEEQHIDEELHMSSDPFADDLFDNNETDDTKGLADTPLSYMGEYATPVGSKNKPKSHYDSPQNNRPSIRSTAASDTSEYDSPRPSLSHRPVSKSSISTIKSLDQSQPPQDSMGLEKQETNGYSSEDELPIAPDPPVQTSRHSSLESPFVYSDSDDIDVNVESAPNALQISEGYNLNDEGENEAVGDLSPLNTDMSGDQMSPGLYLENHGFSNT